MALDRSRCPACGDRYQVRVRCTFAAPSPRCDAAGSDHQHVLCSRCSAERVELLSADELAWLASVN